MRPHYLHLYQNNLEDTSIDERVQVAGTRSTCRRTSTSNGELLVFSSTTAVPKNTVYLVHVQLLLLEKSPHSDSAPASLVPDIALLRGLDCYVCLL
jgi:hypothetical protein